MLSQEKTELSTIKEEIEEFEDLELNPDLLRGIYGKTYIYIWMRTLNL